MSNNSSLNLESLLSQLSNSSDTENLSLLQESIDNLISIANISHCNNNLKLVNTAIKELKQSFDIFLPHQDIPKVCIFGSARTQPDHPNYIMTETISKKLTDIGYDIITGAGPGIMEAGNKGANDDQHFGLNILLPFEQTANKYINHSEKLIDFKYFFTRKLIFIKKSKASIIFPGGFGTHDEGFEVLTLIQTGRCAPRPIVLISNPKSDYWQRWHTYVDKQLCDRGYISKEDLSLYKITHSVDEAIAWIQNYYDIYHSVRYCNSTAIIRINRVISQQTIEKLSEEFSEIIPEGKIKQVSLEDLPEDYPIYPEKPRLQFQFDKTSYGKLNQLILRLNELET